jgi:hypothetical protein
MKKNIITAALLIMSFLLFAVLPAKADVDLTGEYWFGSLKSDVTTHAPAYKRGTVVITGDTWTQGWDDQSGHHTFSSTFTTDVQSDGSLNINLSSGTYNIAFNGDVMIHADNAPDAANRLGIDIIARKAVNPQIAGIAGNYKFFGHYLNWMDLGDSVSWGDIVLNANGTGTWKIVQSDSGSKSGNVNWSIDSANSTMNVEGEIYPQLLCKDGLVLRALDMEPDDEYAYEIIIKKTTQTIVPADIAGTYQVRFLETGPGNVPYTCGQGTVTINADGTYDVDTHYSDGEDDTHHGNFTVGPGNKIRFDGAIDGIISPDKNLIFAPETDRPANPQDYDWIGGLFFIKEINSTPVFQFGSVSGSKAQNLVITDPCGVLVTFSLTGGGYGEILGGGNFEQITLYGTGDKSQLTISAKGNKPINIGSITCNGTMKGITAKSATINGDITINGTSLDPKAAVAITFDESTNLNIASQMPIKSITASDWLGTLTAPSVGSITAKSNPKLDRHGYIDIDASIVGTVGNIKTVYLAGSWNCKSVASITSGRADSFYLTLAQEPNVKVPALGKLTIPGYFSLSRIISAGNIGTFTVGKMISSSCFAGVADACLVDLNADDVCDLPHVLGDTFNQTATIKSIAIKGVKGVDYCFINSNIAAKDISSIYVAYPQYNNSGIPFGISMYNAPKTLKIKDDEGTHSWKGIDIGEAIDWLIALGYNMQIRTD